MMRGIWRDVVAGWGGPCGICLYVCGHAGVRVVVWRWGFVDGMGWDGEGWGGYGQKKRPFQILRSSMVVKGRPEQR